ncbi:MAG: NUDIX domain-containing protein, partial [Planctomycetota bacterium]
NPALIHRTVHVIVTNRRGDLFLQKRGIHKEIQPGRWDTSVGGHVASGEAVDAAVLRELAEELGVVPAPPGPLFRHRYLWRNPVETELVDTFHLVHEGPFDLQAEEIDDGRFWPRPAIDRALGTGIFTPNFEEEYRRFRTTASPA